MNITAVKITKLQLAILALIILGLIVTVILVQKNQTIKSRADEEMFNNLEVTGAKCNYNAKTKQGECQLNENTNTVTINGIQKLKELPAP